MAGLDPRGRRELLSPDTAPRDRNLTLIVCSSSLSDASLLCDRFVVRRRGAVMDPGARVLREADRLARLDITLPEPVIGAREFKKLFPDLPAEILTEDELEAELLKRLGVA